MSHAGYHMDDEWCSIIIIIILRGSIVSITITTTSTSTIGAVTNPRRFLLVVVVVVRMVIIFHRQCHGGPQIIRDTVAIVPNSETRLRGKSNSISISSPSFTTTKDSGGNRKKDRRSVVTPAGTHQPSKKIPPLKKDGWSV